MNPAERDALDQELKDLLAAAAKSDRRGASPRVEDLVLQAWDAQAASRASGRRASRRSYWGITAAAASLVLAAGLMMRSNARMDRPDHVSPPDVAESGGGRYDLATWPDSDPASLQIVRLRVARSELSALGYDVVDPDGDDMIEVEMILGVEGIAYSVRLDTPPDWTSQ